MGVGVDGDGQVPRARYENHVRYMIPLDRQVGYLQAARPERQPWLDTYISLP